MSYQTAIERMYALGHELAQAPSHKFDLAHMRVLLAALENPERRSSGVLIAGTNGKGSTAATLASILQASGVRTGLYTSPHLVRINERVRINGGEISDDDFALLHDVVDRTAERLVGEGELPWHPSFFEMLTAMAFEYFARRKVDLAVLEVGMGGRLEATNGIEPRVSVITDISLDNQKFLVNTVTEIAREKVGISDPHVIAVILPQQPRSSQVIPAANGNPECVFDVAHNPAGAWALRSTLSACYEDRRLIFVFGALRDKAIGEMAEILFPMAERVIATHADNPRSATPDEIG